MKLINFLLPSIVLVNAAPLTTIRERALAEIQATATQPAFVTEYASGSNCIGSSNIVGQTISVGSSCTYLNNGAATASCLPFTSKTQLPSYTLTFYPDYSHCQSGQTPSAVTAASSTCSVPSTQYPFNFLVTCPVAISDFFNVMCPSSLTAKSCASLAVNQIDCTNSQQYVNDEAHFWTGAAPTVLPGSLPGVWPYPTIGVNGPNDPCQKAYKGIMSYTDQYGSTTNYNIQTATTSTLTQNAKAYGSYGASVLTIVTTWMQQYQVAVSSIQTLISFYSGTVIADRTIILQAVDRLFVAAASTAFMGSNAYTGSTGVTTFQAASVVSAGFSVVAGFIALVPVVGPALSILCGLAAGIAGVFGAETPGGATATDVTVDPTTYSTFQIALSYSSTMNQLAQANLALAGTHDTLLTQIATNYGLMRLLSTLPMNNLQTLAIADSNAWTAILLLQYFNAVFSVSFGPVTRGYWGTSCHYSDGGLSFIGGTWTTFSQNACIIQPKNGNSNAWSSSAWATIRSQFKSVFGSSFWLGQDFPSTSGMTLPFGVQQCAITKYQVNPSNIFTDPACGCLDYSTTRWLPSSYTLPPQQTGINTVFSTSYCTASQVADLTSGNMKAPSFRSINIQNTNTLIR